MKYSFLPVCLWALTATAFAAPGTLTSLRSITLKPGSQLKLELGGSTAGTGHDQLIARGGVVLESNPANTPPGPALSVELINGFQPASGTGFDVLEGAVTGVFDNLTLPGAGWSAASLYTDGILTFSTAAGYAAWLTEYNLTGLDAAGDADPDKDGVPNFAEYTLGSSPRSSATGLSWLPGPSLQSSVNGPVPALTFSVPATPVADMLIEVQAQNSLSGIWSTITSRAGNGAWTGTAAVDTGAPTDGRVALTVREATPVSTQTRRFYRLKFTPLN